jgi:HD-like signal output (HDOD) protein
LNTKQFINFITNNTTAFEFLDFVLHNIKFENLNIKHGFISCLDESKISVRFKIVSSIGRFLHSEKIKIISSKEIDQLSTVYMTKQIYIKNNLYIDYLNINSQNIFIYLEFEEIITEDKYLEIKQASNTIIDILKNTNWGSSMKTIVKEIEEIPALSKTVMETLKFSTKENKTSKELIGILSTDPLVVVNLLKTVNSAIFGFRNEVESIENLIYLMGIDFTISMILANSVEESVDINISAYGIDTTQFKELLANKIKFVNSWVRKENINIEKKLYLPLILHDLGKFILSKELNQTNKIDVFLSELKKDHQNINKIERKYSNYTSKEISVLVLEHWDLNKNIIRYLSDESSEIFKFIELIDIIFNIIKPLDSTVIKRAEEEATKLNINIDLLKKEIEAINI